MQILSANLNGIRAATSKGFNEIIEQYQPDVVCVQETKAQAKTLDLKKILPDGYHHYFSDALKKGYSGVGIFTKQEPQQIKIYGDPLFDDEGRYLEAHLHDFIVISLYLPSGTSGQARQNIKMRCLEKILQEKLMAMVDKKVIICGDFNIAHNIIDIKNWRSNQKSSGFLPEERSWFSSMLELGYIDSFRALNPELVQYTWWTYRANARSRNVGWRIDYQITTPKVNIIKSEVINEPIISDHAPLLLTTS